ncbi:MAG TPA: hypothetical protein PLO23_09755 [Alphaproteobacteria bacterium]|nr:hypothetical protein [Alphaproteobacteria bacterium]
MNVYNRSHWTNLKVPGVTVSVSPRPDPKAAVFMVKSIIDDGRGRQSIVLGDPEFLILEAEYLMEPRRFIPPALGKTTLIYTGRFAMHIPHLHKALADFYKTSRVEHITPDVLQPGDFVVFKRGKGGQILESLRVMCERKYRRYAL